jgi:hypothetical protein
MLIFDDDEDTLEAIDKQQNLRMPILEAIKIINECVDHDRHTAT